MTRPAGNRGPQSLPPAYSRLQRYALAGAAALDGVGVGSAAVGVGARRARCRRAVERRLGIDRPGKRLLERILRLAVGREVSVGEGGLPVLDRLLRIAQRLSERRARLGCRWGRRSRVGVGVGVGSG